MYPETQIVRQNFGQDNKNFQIEVVPQLKKSFYNFSDNLVVKSQIIYQNHPDLEKYENSHILILGGGPSTDIIDWLDIDYDFVWSMNHCFFNEKIDYIGVDFLTIGCSVDLQNEILQKFLEKNNPLTAFELHAKYYLQRTNPQQSINEANEKFYYNNRKICYQTKWYSQLGTGVRQIIFASHLKPRKISFLGFDGPKAIYEKNHAFATKTDQWESQHMLPGSIRHLSKQQIYELFEYGYNMFWLYITTLFPDVEFNSVDKDNKYHELIL